MPDPEFAHPRLAAVYDVLGADRADLAPYVAMAAEFGARHVVDLGCGTGVLALLLADRDLQVTAIDPAAASLAVARAKPGAGRVDWIDGDATALPVAAVDLVLMTGNAAQAVDEPDAWDLLLSRVHEALRPGGRFVFETRDAARRAWEGWHPAATRRVVDAGAAGEIETWTELVAVRLPLVSFRATWVFRADATVLTSESTLRFRDRDELARDLHRHRFQLDGVRDAPARPGLEFVVVASRR